MEYEVLRNEHKRLLVELKDKQNDLTQAFAEQKLFFEVKPIVKEINLIKEKVKLIERLLVLIFNNNRNTAA